MTTAINFIAVDRTWFLTWTTYGTWLPGDRRGFVGSVRDELGEDSDHNEVGTPPALPNPRLKQSSEDLLKAPPVILNPSQAIAVIEQFQETCRIRGWLLIAVGIMHTHLHVMVGVPGDPDPETILRDLKAYASGRLNRQLGTEVTKEWWTKGGSKRKMDNDRAVESALHYIRHQPNPLVIWTREFGREV